MTRGGKALRRGGLSFLLAFLMLACVQLAQTQPTVLETKKLRKLVQLQGFGPARGSNVVPNRFLIQLRPRAEAAISGRNGKLKRKDKRPKQLVSKMRSAKLSVQLTRQFASGAWDGFTLQTADSSSESVLGMLDDSTDVLSIFPVAWLPAPNASLSQVDAASLRGAYLASDSSLSTNSTSLRLAAAGYRRMDGFGIKVGIIDTGIDYTHPALGGGFGPKFKVAYGRDFVGDAFRPGGPPASPDNDPMDCNGHGTHVAGIIAGSAGFAADGSPLSSDPAAFRYQGVAPGVTLGAYKVFGCSGGTTTELVIAAMDQAVQDGMQVINLSLGDEGEWGGSLAEAATRVARRGVLVVVAGGNAGQGGLFTQSSLGSAPGVMAVGSVQSLAAPLSGLTLNVSGLPTASGNGRTSVSFPVLAAYGSVSSLVTGAVQPSDSAMRAGKPYDGSGEGSDGCSTNGLGDFQGAVALLEAGGCSIAVKAANAAARGAAGVIVYGSTSVMAADIAGVTPPRLVAGGPGTLQSPYGVPVLLVNADAGARLYNAYMSDPNVSAGQVSAGVPSPPPPKAATTSPPPSSSRTATPSPHPSPLPVPAASPLPSPSPVPAPSFPPSPAPPSPPPAPAPSPPPSPAPLPAPSPPHPLSSPPLAPPPAAPSSPSPSWPLEDDGEEDKNGEGDDIGEDEDDQGSNPSPAPAPAPDSGSAATEPVVGPAPVQYTEDEAPPSGSPPVASPSAPVATGAPQPGALPTKPGRRLLFPSRRPGARGKRGLSASGLVEGVLLEGRAGGPHEEAQAERQEGAQGRRLLQMPRPLTIISISGSIWSPFSSWGPSPDLAQRPSLAAPGGTVLSTVPRRRPDGTLGTGYAYMSGTSQAAPYVSAAAAIYLMANRANQVTAPQVEAALVASARPLPNLSNGQPLVSTLRSGGGVVDIASLLTNLVDVSPSKLQLATGQAAQTFTFDVFNRGTVALTFRASHRGAASVDSSSLVRVGPQPGTRNNSRTVLPYVPVEADPAVTAVFGNGARNTTQFTIQPRSSTRITVYVQVADWAARRQLFLSGFLVLDPVPPILSEDDFSKPAVQAALLQPTISLPYLGYSQSLMSLPVLLPTLPGGMSDPSGSWWWDDQAAGLSSTTVTLPPPPPDNNYGPPPHDLMDDGGEIINKDQPGGNTTTPVRPPPPPPPAPLFTYSLSGSNPSLPSLALWLQRQPASQELQLYSNTFGTLLGNVLLNGMPLDRPPSGPLVLTWRGTYYDLARKRELPVGPGDYYFVVQMVRGRAAADGDRPGEATVADRWRTPMFRLRS